MWSEDKNPGQHEIYLKIFAGEWGTVDKLTGGSGFVVSL